jgi:hypothetical protein
MQLGAACYNFTKCREGNPVLIGDREQVGRMFEIAYGGRLLFPLFFRNLLIDREQKPMLRLPSSVIYRLHAYARGIASVKRPQLLALIMAFGIVSQRLGSGVQSVGAKQAEGASHRSL